MSRPAALGVSRAGEADATTDRPVGAPCLRKLWHFSPVVQHLCASQIPLCCCSAPAEHAQQAWRCGGAPPLEAAISTSPHPPWSQAALESWACAVQRWTGRVCRSTCSQLYTQCTAAALLWWNMDAHVRHGWNWLWQWPLLAQRHAAQDPTSHAAACLLTCKWPLRRPCPLPGCAGSCQSAGQ